MQCETPECEIRRCIEIEQRFPTGGTKLEVKGYKNHWPQSSYLNGFVEEFTFVLKKRLSRLKKYVGKMKNVFDTCIKMVNFIRKQDKITEFSNYFVTK